LTPRSLRVDRISEGRFVCVFAFVGFVIFASFVSAQSFRSRIDVVQVTVTVTDSEGRLITGLTKDDFQIFEDGNAQDITQFTDARVPVSLGVLLDASDSMRGQPIVDAREALDRFVGELLLGEDEALVASFNHRPRLATTWTMPPSRTRNSLESLKPSGGTAIYDALASTSKLFEQRNHVRAAMVLISDGADTASDHSLLQALEDIRRSDALVYAIAIDSADAKESTRVNPEALRVLRPGGRLIVLETPIYKRKESGERMAAERHQQFEKRYGTRSDSVPSIEYLTWQMLRDLGQELNLNWKVIRPWYGLKWALRPWIARLKRKREPSRFAILVAERKESARQ